MQFEFSCQFPKYIRPWIGPLYSLPMFTFLYTFLWRSTIFSQCIPNIIAQREELEGFSVLFSWLSQSRGHFAWVSNSNSTVPWDRMTSKTFSESYSDVHMTTLKWEGLATLTFYVPSAMFRWQCRVPIYLTCKAVQAQNFFIPSSSSQLTQYINWLEDTVRVLWYAKTERYFAPGHEDMLSIELKTL
jgi:hypothetical protein